MESGGSPSVANRRRSKECLWSEEALYGKERREEPEQHREDESEFGDRVSGDESDQEERDADGREAVAGSSDDERHGIPSFRASNLSATMTQSCSAFA